MTEKHLADLKSVSGEKNSNQSVFPRLLSMTKGPIDRFVNSRRIARACRQIAAKGHDHDFPDRLLAALNISYDITDKDLARIPGEGPVIVLANQPFGVVGCLVLSQILRSVRSDAGIMTSPVLKEIPELGDRFIFVEPLEKGAMPPGDRFFPPQVTESLQSGGMVGLFLPGALTNIQFHKRKPKASSWRGAVVDLITATGAAVLPMNVICHRKVLLQLLGRFNPRIKSVALPREMACGVNKKLEVRTGSLIPFEKLGKIGDREDIVRYLRLRTDMLNTRKHAFRAVSLPSLKDETVEPVAPAQLPEVLIGEVRDLPDEALLVATDKFNVYLAEAARMPHLMQELGRLREITFRAVGEGTGKARDFDSFDDYYQHLFLWSNEKNELAGAYRLGLTDRIQREKGVEGLYTHTLFKYDTRFMEQINPALELGRSFIRVEYQKTYQALMLLWKGIGRFICRNPQYKILFGPVSITSDYQSASRHLIAAYFRENNRLTDLARLVRPRNPLRKKTIKRRQLKDSLDILGDIQELSEMISEIEGDRKGIPILLKQYVKLGGQSLGFNVDADFSDVLDALILVDLTKTDRRILERYMGKKEAAALIAFHGGRDLADCA